MICKECGAYNPDHATYCKVCAASLKDDTLAAQPTAEETPAEAETPAQRFSRPNWSVPTYAKQTPEAPSPIEDEPSEESEAPVRDIPADEPTPVDEPEAVSEPEAEDEAPEAPAWKRPAPAAQSFADEDEVYNDEEAFDDEDAYEYEPTAPKSKGKGKKNSTLFWVLLVAIIVVIVAILGVGAYLLFFKNSTNLNCSVPAIGGKATDAPDATVTDVPTDPSAPTLTETTIDGVDCVVITLSVPAHGSATFVLPHQDNHVVANDNDVDKSYDVNIPKSVYYPETPLDAAAYTVTPEAYITDAAGTQTAVTIPSYTETFPSLRINLTTPVADESGVIMANEKNVVSINGTVDDHTVAVTINGTATTVYTDGIFMMDYTMTTGESETITIVATKNNCVTATQTITAEPYVFVPEAMALTVSDSISDLRADSSGKVVVKGTTLAGATVTGTSDTATVLCGTAAVGADGAFTMTVTMDNTFYGMANITINATKEGAETASKSVIVTRIYKDKDAFVKAYGKKYYEINTGMTMTQLTTSSDTYATNEYGFRVIATIVSVETVGNYTYVKMTVAKTGETIYMMNMSAKWTPADKIGSKYRIYCSYAGAYGEGDAAAPLFVAWFCYNA